MMGKTVPQARPSTRLATPPADQRQHLETLASLGLQNMGAKYAQHHRCDGGNGAQITFVVAENIAAEFARQEQAVDVPLEIALLRKHIAAEAGNRDKRHDGPIPDQQGDGPRDLAAQLGHQRDDGGKNVRKRNALQHAGVAKVREVELQDPVEDQAQNDQQRGAAQDVGEDGLATLTAAQTALDGEVADLARR